ncbi:hypothetical protein G7Z17_g4724 [Cylindrodendrum hubeiense]|uniref:AB hydrolase-1 domain-containing protein n=1 Tax=Cylindrodendrum hubeiense TaxID=595255 RepID=A0A9P5HGC9_9HYPO|nr:hypothetical protein G7Z17_g4724 [Cylindrodendrum hubeiense]
MSEKVPFSLPAPVARPKSNRVLWSRLTIAAFALLSGVNFYRRLSGDCGHTATRSYVGETVQWKPCGSIIDHEIECADILVPMDQFDAVNSGDKTFQIPLIRLRGRNATQNLFVNPGGPGGSGINFMYRKGELLNRIVGENFHILSFDPRGVNSSLPRASCYPTSDTRVKHSLAFDSDAVRESPSRYAWTQNYVTACQENLGEHGKYINTPQTAADMNTILDAIGQQDMVYWGFSYGTLLGQTYASLFPDRSKRVIIDGVVDQIQWYESPLLDADFVDTQNVLDGFFEECIKSADNCALSDLADSKEELQEKVVKFIQGLEQDPVSVFLNTTNYGTIDYKTIWFDAIFSHLYKPATWFEFATRLSDLIRGNATEAFLAYGTEDLSGVTDDAIDVVHLNDGASGLKYWPHTRLELLDMLLPYYNSSSFAISEGQTYYAKQQWLIPRTHDFKARRRIETAHPLLVLSTTYDPICPLISAKGAQETFVGSRLVEVKGYGHCSLAVTSACVARHVRDFLDSGKLPEENVQCEVDEPYFQAPEPEEVLIAKLTTAETEGERIRAAQMLMAGQLRL